MPSKKPAKKEDTLLEDWNRLLLMEDMKYTLRRYEVDALLDFCLDAMEADVQSERTVDVYNILQKLVTYLMYTEKLEKAQKKSAVNAKKPASKEKPAKSTAKKKV